MMAAAIGMIIVALALLIFCVAVMWKVFCKAGEPGWEDMGLVELATVSFGQSFQITPIQLITTAASIINGGNRVTPHFAVKTVSADGSDVRRFSYPVKEHIVSEETSQTMRYILEQVVAAGSGSNPSKANQVYRTL